MSLEKKYKNKERIIAKANFSGYVYFKELILAVALGGILAVLFIYGATIETAITKSVTVVALTESNLRWVLIAFGVIWAIAVIVESIRLSQREVLLLETSLVIKSGIMSTNITVIPVNEIVSVESSVSILGRLFGVGRMYVVSASNESYQLKNIRKPALFAEKIIETAKKARYKARTTTVQIKF